jgi:mutator protein MutT
MANHARNTRIFVGAVVKRDDKILLVRQAAGHRLAGQWTVPWGGVEPDETAAEAAVRETYEEGGIKAEVVGLLGLQDLPAPQIGSMSIIFLCKHVDGDPQPHGNETDAARYFTQTQLKALKEPMEPWSAWMCERVFNGRIQVIRAAASNPLKVRASYL